MQRQAAIGRLGQVCDRWIYTACLCFALDTAEQGISGFRYDYSTYQAEYSRNLLFRSGGKMEDLFDRVLEPDPAPAGYPGAADPVRPLLPAAMECQRHWR